MGYEKAKKLNFRCAVLAMILTQVLFFQLEMTVLANVATYVINLVAWVIIGFAMEFVIFLVYEVEPAEAG